LKMQGYHNFDALHLAMAEDCSCAFLITTDDQFLRKARRAVGNPTVHVINPLDWNKETKL
jgi:predicted nucleic acid-binding protein